MDQTYPNREMLIIADGEDVSDLLPQHAPGIRLIHIPEGFKIGEKRNFGCQRAAGEIICHWDDDDFSAPERITDQVGRLLQTGKAVTGYRTMPFTDGARWWLYAGTPMFALGTSLCYRRDWWEQHQFPILQVGEDNQFVSAAAGATQIAVSDAGDLMYATIHAGNTSPRQLDGNNSFKVIQR